MFVRRYLLVMCCISAVTGCGGAQIPSTPQGQPWMSPDAQSADLLYLSNVSTNHVDVFSYPQGKRVATLTKFGQPRAECADRFGNVWIADIQGYDVVEYPHGASKPIAALSTPAAPRGCSVDPKGGKLAVTSEARHVVVAIYHRSARGIWSDPKEYGDGSIRSVRFCGYDADGNLFVDGVGKNSAFQLAELPRNGKSFEDVTVKTHIASPGQVQWDGTYLAIGDAGVTPSVIDRFSVKEGKATKISSTQLDDTKSVRQFWIDGSRVIGPDFDAPVGFWKYPAGGSATKRITTVRGYGAAVSLAADSARK